MFKFTLQTALNVRGRQEKLKMKELAEKLALERQVINQIDKITLDLRNADSNMNASKESRTLSIAGMKYLAHFKGRMRILMAQKQAELTDAKKEVHVKQLALIQASKAKRTLEILREKEEKKYLENITKTENRQLDEIAGNQFFQNQKNPRL